MFYISPRPYPPSPAEIFHKSGFVVLVSMKTKYCFSNADTSWPKLSMEFPSSHVNHFKEDQVRFSAKMR